VVRIPDITLSATVDNRKSRRSTSKIARQRHFGSRPSYTFSSTTFYIARLFAPGVRTQRQATLSAAEGWQRFVRERNGHYVIERDHDAIARLLDFIKAENRSGLNFDCLPTDVVLEVVIAGVKEDLAIIDAEAPFRDEYLVIEDPPLAAVDATERQRIRRSRPWFSTAGPPPVYRPTESRVERGVPSQPPRFFVPARHVFPEVLRARPRR